MRERRCRRAGGTLPRPTRRPRLSCTPRPEVAVPRWDYRAVEFQLDGEYEITGSDGRRQKLRGPHVTWRSGGQSMQDALCDLGSNGWEMCGVAPSTQNFLCHIVYL